LNGHFQRKKELKEFLRSKPWGIGSLEQEDDDYISRLRRYGLALLRPEVSDYCFVNSEEFLFWDNVGEVGGEFPSKPFLAVDVHQ
jgi:hypothetical protein